MAIKYHDMVVGNIICFESYHYLVVRKIIIFRSTILKFIIAINIDMFTVTIILLILNKNNYNLCTTTIYCYSKHSVVAVTMPNHIFSLRVHTFFAMGPRLTYTLWLVG